jgi:hypothetical protein
MEEEVLTAPKVAQVTMVTKAEQVAMDPMDSMELMDLLVALVAWVKTGWQVVLVLMVAPAKMVDLG